MLGTLGKWCNLNMCESKTVLVGRLKTVCCLIVVFEQFVVKKSFKPFCQKKKKKKSDNLAKSVKATFVTTDGEK
jgi:hypothetical protein